MGTSFWTTLVTSTSGGGGEGAAFWLWQPRKTNGAIGRRAQMDECIWESTRELLLSRLLTVNCIGRAPNVQSWQSSWQSGHRPKKDVSFVAYQPILCTGIIRP